MTDDQDINDDGATPQRSDSHQSRRPWSLTRRATRLTLAALVPAAVLTVVGLVWLWPGTVHRQPWTGPDVVNGQVLIVNERPCAEGTAAFPGQGSSPQPKCGDVSVRLDSGERVTTPIPAARVPP